MTEVEQLNILRANLDAQIKVARTEIKSLSEQRKEVIARLDALAAETDAPMMGA